jgi:hypothetical protein
MGTTESVVSNVMNKNLPVSSASQLGDLVVAIQTPRATQGPGAQPLEMLFESFNISPAFCSRLECGRFHNLLN